MLTALIVSNIDKHIKYFEFMLNTVLITDISVSTTAKETRNLLITEYYDIIIIDTPLDDELGKKLAKDIKEKEFSQIIYCVQDDDYKKTEEELFNIGINTLSKPFNRKIFISILKTCAIASSSIKALSNENKKLIKKIEELKTIDRAKYLLMSYLKMSESEAHKYIEKQAMNNRVSKYEISIKILKTYAS